MKVESAAEISPEAERAARVVADLFSRLTELELAGVVMLSSAAKCSELLGCLVGRLVMDQGPRNATNFLLAVVAQAIAAGAEARGQA